ncbi:MAG TPA: hypothetical protein VN048_18030 [Verrucomicrobiae bacterium]|jgi:hypothetical protein|nr:hypothetical protein [Verrucomicrobiae bacterium]
MKINPNTDPVRVGGAQPPKPAASATPAVAEADAFASSTAVNSALRNSPDSRPEAVDRARELINDPSYPGTDTLRKISQFLADQIGNPNE